MVSVQTLRARLRTHQSTVGAYMRSADMDAVRRVRDIVGHVTVSGGSGLAVLQALARHDDVRGVDLDPATYADGGDHAPTLFPIDWVAEQRRLGLPVIRSATQLVPRGDPRALRSALSERLDADVVRVVCLHESWLRPPALSKLLSLVRPSDGALSLVLAAHFDPLQSRGAVDGLRALLEAASAHERRVELIRADVNAIGLVAEGAVLGSVGLGTSTRHLGLPFARRDQAAYKQRQLSPQAWVPALMGWQHGAKMGALTPFDGAGITACDCRPCAGRSLLRFDTTWAGSVPPTIRDDARAHDVASWLALARRILAASDPTEAWRNACKAACDVEATLIERYKLSALSVPDSIRQWC